MIAISLRTDLNFSYFKRNILSILSYPDFDTVIICSGYFQENATYSVTSDDILNTILANGNFTNINYLIIGGNFGYGKYGMKSDWHIQFDNFLKELRKNKIPFKAYLDKRKKWHAKIAIGIEKNVPKVAIIGSSNLTAPAYSEKHHSFNIECDTTLLMKEKKLENHFNLQSFVTDNPLSPIITEMSPDFNQPGLLERLKALSNEVQNDLLDEYTDF